MVTPTFRRRLRLRFTRVIPAVLYHNSKLSPVTLALLLVLRALKTELVCVVGAVGRRKQPRAVRLFGGQAWMSISARTNEYDVTLLRLSRKVWYLVDNKGTLNVVYLI